jgi:tetratricopeptide (TPR) repeat protein
MARADLLNALGDFAAAKADIEAALARNPDRASINDRLAWLLATCPRASLRDPQRAMELAAAAVSLNPEKASYWNTLGVAQYRAYEYSSAVESLLKSTERRAGGDAGDFFFLAMAHWQLGNKDEARQWYDRSLKWISDHSSTDEKLIRFQGEAEATMGIGRTRVQTPS